ncbi:MAG: hypothetical protein R3B96_12630 [Pirellulaceae bacterium]
MSQISAHGSGQAPQRVVAGSIIPFTITVTNESANSIEGISVIPEAPQGVRVQIDFEQVGEIGELAPGES